DGGKTTGYAVEAAIPWSAYAKAANHPPKPGEVWRVNFYGMHDNGGVAWSPILGQGNFHKATRFGKVTWAAAAPGAGATPAPSASVAVAAAPDGGHAAMPKMAMPLKVRPAPATPNP
ncbi:MAG: hypothetical protein JOZ69_08560, partial [Myxococcales bacterium]|nr:hypothetical protein [Myxococcales bacterium]